MDFTFRKYKELVKSLKDQKYTFQTFEDFIKKAVKKSEARPFKVPDKITLMVVDPLTGCYNRREFENQINRHIAMASRHGHHLSLFMFDLDFFKQINSMSER